MSNDKKRDMKKGFTTFVKAEKIGICPCCGEDVHTDQLYVKETVDTIGEDFAHLRRKVYHYACYNRKVAEENGRQ